MKFGTSAAIARLRTACFGLLLACVAGSGCTSQSINMPKGVTEISHEVYHLHMLIFWVCVAIGVVVFGAMILSIVLHRKSKGREAAQFHESTAVEIGWTIVPFVILVAMAIPATRTLIAMEDTSKADMRIKVTGYQWKWRYDYLDEDFGFFSTLATPRKQIHNLAAKDKNYLLEVDNQLVLPVGKRIRFEITSGDVIHSWWVPDLALKRDAIPGFINEMWTRIDEPGVYRGQCAELCGRDHGFMPVVVRAVEQDKYDEWVKAHKDRKDKSAAATNDGGQQAAATGGQGLAQAAARGEDLTATIADARHALGKRPGDGVRRE